MQTFNPCPPTAFQRSVRCLPHKNAAIVAEPGHALIDSDLDWGQDMRLLQKDLAARGVKEVHYGLFGALNPCDPAWPKLIPLEPGKPVTGWVVLSEQFYRSGLHFSFRRESCEAGADGRYRFHADPADAFDWLKAVEPVARVGASVRVYWVGAHSAAN